MNSRFGILLLVALLMAGGAGYVAKNWVDLQTRVRPTTVGPNTVQIYVAAMNIPFATRIEKMQLKLMAWPKDNVPAQAFTEEEINKNPNAIIGKVTQREFFPDEILLKPQIKEHLGGSTLSALIEEGKRAMSVRVDDVVGVAGFILPNNKADIIVTGSGTRIECMSSEHGYKVIPMPVGNQNGTYTLLPNIKILAIDQLASQDQDKPAVVRALTLEVTPQQAECLVHAMRTGALQFTLRNPMDNDDYIIPTAEEPHIVPVQSKPEKPYKAQLTIKILPWGSQTFIECIGGTC